MRKAKKVLITKGQAIALIVSLAVIFALVFVGSNNQQAQAQKMEDNGITISVSESLASQLLGLISSMFGGNDTAVGIGTRFPSGLSADSTSPADGEVRGTTLTITSTSAFTGAVTASGGLTSSNNTFTQGGVTVYRDTQAFDTATTTVCSLQSPTATSTLISAGATFDVSSTTASTITMAKATTAFATTTSLGVVSLGADAQGTIVASTTPTGDLLDSEQVFGPSEWFVIGMAGGTGTFSPTGDCYAHWEGAN